MLLTIEKVLILKSVHVLSSVPEPQLVEIANIIDTVEYQNGDVIIVNSIIKERAQPLYDLGHFVGAHPVTLLTPLSTVLPGAGRS